MAWCCRGGDGCVRVCAREIEHRGASGIGGGPVTWRREASKEEACVGGNRQRYEVIWRGGRGLSEG